MTNTTKRLLILRGALMLLAISGLCWTLASCGGDRHSEHASGVQLVGTPGWQPGQFSKPRGVAVTASGLIVVIDRTGRVILHDLRTGDFVRQFRLQAWQKGTPTGISIDPLDDSIWVADTHYHRILQYSQDGDLMFQFGEEGEEPGRFVFITDVCPDPDGQTLWVTDYGRRNRIMQFTREGQFIREWGTELFETEDLQRPMSILLSPDGQRLYVVDTGNCRINVYTRDGEHIKSFGEPGRGPGQFNMPQDMALGPEGHLYIIEYSNCRISTFTLDGEFLGAWGTSGNAPGQFFTPWGIATARDGTIVVADTMNHRLQVIRRPQDLAWNRPETGSATP